ncbi:hypothetical protein NP233_g8267 [Leucocoprinus birnbaumii]|uniref:Uncharacterized protein n=1 Tax=Leucocoprinus birnbaumii TaxID=56174 RepID=A0AAD5VMV1_9AGAR|nr:hypothetical protein NP233_g8267 [Leucocoprinus birnbaumii]
MKVNSNSCKGDAEGIVVHTCQPCNPSISATQTEEISVYQMMLGPYLLLRRIDTDFVNLTPIVEWCGKGRGYPVLSTVPNAVVVGRGWGSEKVVGVWVPLEVAQSYVKDLDTISAGAAEEEKEKSEVMEGLDVFLSDELVERFPSALKDFHKTNSSGRMLKQFGRWFESMVTCAHAQATAAAANAGASTSSTMTNAISVAVASCATSSGPLNPQKVMQGDSRQSWMQKETVVPVANAFALGAVLTIGEREKLQLHQRQDSGSLWHRRTMSSGLGMKQEDRLDCVSPLSAKEQEMFQELCVIPGEEEEKMKVEEEDCRMEIESVVCVVEKREEEEDIPKVVVGGTGGVVSVVNVSVEPAVAVEEDKSPSAPEASRPLDEAHSSSTPSTEPVEEPEPSEAAPAPPTRTRPTRAATTSKLYEKLEQEQEKVDRSQTLRRSKRVAAAAQTQQSSQNSSQQQQQKTRVRKRPGSRNTLS